MIFFKKFFWLKNKAFIIDYLIFCNQKILNPSPYSVFNFWIKLIHTQLLSDFKSSIYYDKKCWDIIFYYGTLNILLKSLNVIFDTDNIHKCRKVPQQNCKLSKLQVILVWAYRYQRQLGILIFESQLFQLRYVKQETNL